MFTLFSIPLFNLTIDQKFEDFYTMSLLTVCYHFIYFFDLQKQ